MTFQSVLNQNNSKLKLIKALICCVFSLQLFFIQACQGDRLDGGVSMRATTETDANSSISYSIPVHADFLIAYSTIPGESLDDGKTSRTLKRFSLSKRESQGLWSCINGSLYTKRKVACFIHRVNPCGGVKRFHSQHDVLSSPLRALNFKAIERKQTVFSLSPRLQHENPLGWNFSIFPVGRTRHVVWGYSASFFLDSFLASDHLPSINFYFRFLLLAQHH